MREETRDGEQAKERRACTQNLKHLDRRQVKITQILDFASIRYFQVHVVNTNVTQDIEQLSTAPHNACHIDQETKQRLLLTFVKEKKT